MSEITNGASTVAAGVSPAVRAGLAIKSDLFFLSLVRERTEVRVK
jgi:hypothetical protein